MAGRRYVLLGVSLGVLSGTGLQTPPAILKTDNAILKTDKMGLNDAVFCWVLV